MSPGPLGTLYERLEVGPNASFEEIDRAYDRIMAYLGEGALAMYAMLDDPVDLDEQREGVQEAYRILSDPALRADYDRARARGEAYLPTPVPSPKVNGVGGRQGWQRSASTTTTARYEERGFAGWETKSSPASSSRASAEAPRAFSSSAHGFGEEPVSARPWTTTHSSEDVSSPLPSPEVDAHPEPRAHDEAEEPALTDAAAIDAESPKDAPVESRATDEASPQGASEDTASEDTASEDTASAPEPDASLSDAPLVEAALIDAPESDPSPADPVLAATEVADPNVEPVPSGEDVTSIAAPEERPSVSVGAETPIDEPVPFLDIPLDDVVESTEGSAQKTDTHGEGQTDAPQAPGESSVDEPSSAESAPPPTVVRPQLPPPLPAAMLARARAQSEARPSSPTLVPVSTSHIPAPKGLRLHAADQSLLDAQGELDGTALRRLRESANATLSDVAKITKINKRYLRALEDHDFAALPAEVYIRGFVREYAKVFGLSADDVARGYMLMYARRKKETGG